MTLLPMQEANTKHQLSHSASHLYSSSGSHKTTVGLQAAVSAERRRGRLLSACAYRKSDTFKTLSN